MRPLILGFCISWYGSLFSQARNQNWVFGQQVWMSFTNDTINFLPSTYTAQGRNACISDTLGNLELVVDDSGIRNAVFDFVAGGTTAELGWPAEQGNYLILPRPENYGHYYVLLNAHDALKQAGIVEVDATANGGAGAVIGTTTWYAQNTTAKLAATPHANGMDYWVLQHEDGTDAFRAYQLTNAGLGVSPVITHAGSMFTASTTTNQPIDYWGPMKFSLQGDRIALVKQGSTRDTTLVGHFTFNTATGAPTFLAETNNMAKRLSLGVPVAQWSSQRQISGVEFDAAGHYLYIYEWDSTFVVENAPYGFQITLTDPDPSSLQASMIFMVDHAFTMSYYNDAKGNSLQMGPDGGLYWRLIKEFHADRWLRRFGGLPASIYDVPPFAPETLFPTTHLGAGFPNLCKRYNDSEPKWLAVAEQSASTTLNAWPNPLEAEGALRMNGNVWPTVLRWYDMTGRCVRNEPAEQNGPTILLHRAQLPSGLYVVEALDHGRSIGRAKVLCE